MGKATRGLKRFGKGLGNVFGSTAPALGGIGGAALGGMYGGPQGMMAGSMLGGALGQGIGSQMQFGGFGANKGARENPNNFMPGQGQYGNVPMGRMGEQMGQNMGNRFGNAMGPGFSEFGNQLGQMGGQYAQRKMNEYMPESYRDTAYGNLPQEAMGRGLRGLENMSAGIGQQQLGQQTGFEQPMQALEDFDMPAGAGERQVGRLPQNRIQNLEGMLGGSGQRPSVGRLPQQRMDNLQGMLGGSGQRPSVGRLPQERMDNLQGMLGGQQYAQGGRVHNDRPSGLRNTQMNYQPHFSAGGFFNDVKKGLTGAANTVTHGLSDAGNAISHGASSGVGYLNNNVNKPAMNFLHNNGGGIGGTLGGLAGGVLGSTFGPAGTIAGGTLGSYLGEGAGNMLTNGKSFGQNMNSLGNNIQSGFNNAGNAVMGGPGAMGQLGYGVGRELLPHIGGAIGGGVLGRAAGLGGTLAGHFGGGSLGSQLQSQMPRTLPNMPMPRFADGGSVHGYGLGGQSRSGLHSPFDMNEDELHHQNQYAMGGHMPYGYAGGGQMGLRELADMISQAASGMGGGQMGEMGSGGPSRPTY